MISILLASAALLTSSPAVADAVLCEVPPPYLKTEEMVATADVIVRAVVVRDRTGAAADSVGVTRDVGMGLAWLELRVLDVLKGDTVPATLYIPGVLTEADAFNRDPVPYRSRRPSLSASCHAYGYRRGGEYLLVLRSRGGSLSPYYASAPTNEQVRGADDPWVRWVRAHLRRSAAGR